MYFALVFTLLVSLGYNSGERFGHHARRLHSIKDTTDSASRTSYLVDSNDRSGLGNELQFARNRRDASAVPESNPIIMEKSVESSMSNEKKREKRFIFLALPALLPAISAMFPAVALATTAVVAVPVLMELQQPRPISFRSTYYPSPEAVQKKKANPKAESKPTLIHTTANQPPPEDPLLKIIEDFIKDRIKDEIEDRVKNVTQSWLDNEHGNTYEWNPQDGELDVYRTSDKEHIGIFDQYTGKIKSGPVPSRKPSDERD